MDNFHSPMDIQIRKSTVIVKNINFGFSKGIFEVLWVKKNKQVSGNGLYVCMV